MGLDRYRLLAQLGAGSDGISYRAVEDGVGSPATVATEVEVRDVSRARVTPGRWERLVPRLRLAAGLAHPAAVRVLDAGLEADPPYVALEWVGTTTMAVAGASTGPWSRADAIELVRTLAGALEEAHRLGLAHGRLGPGQVFLVDGGPKLDFTGVDAGFPIGSAASRALDAACRDPRAGDGPAADRAADLYSLGVLCVWMLTGQTGQTDRELCIAGLDSGPLLGGLIRGLLAEDPADRPTASEVRERLDRAGRAVPARRHRGLGRDGTDDRAGRLIPSIRRVRATVDIQEPRTLVLDAGRPRLGRYRLLDKLGEGGQGVVYRAEDPAEGTVVAIKVLRTDRAGDTMGLRRFRKEARLMAEANNPHVVNLLEYNEEDGIPYLVLEFVAGESLDATAE